MALDLLAGLDPEQREVALAVDQPVCVLAGAGTGKTRAITHRIAYAVHSGHADPARSLALTFTTRAASELRDRLALLSVPDVQARTFHAAALRQLRYFWPRVEGTEAPRLVPGKTPFARQAARELGLAEALVPALITEVEWAKVSLVLPDDFVVAAGQRQLPVDAEQVAEFYRAYESIKAADAAMDFEDVLLIMSALIEENSAVAEQIREQYRHFTVDEYQDVSPLQQHLLDLWIGDHTDVCVVGDPQQTIYSFAGATSDFLRDFAERRHATVIRLFRDYRSTPAIVDFANRLVPVDHHLVGQRPEGPPPEVIMVAEDESAVIAERIRGLLRDGEPAQEMAVLFRTNAQADSFARVLAARGVPASVRRVDGDEGEASGVTVASLHAAKGLEWDTVFIAGVMEGLLPISYATTDEAIAEEKRLFYVGVTRARQRLVITYQGERSRFLIRPTARSEALPAPRAATVSTCRICGRPLGSAAARKRGRCADCPGAPDAPTLARLRSWRSDRAVRDGLPEFVVATDATLEALAEVRPETIDAVREVAGPRVARSYGPDILALVNP